MSMLMELFAVGPALLPDRDAVATWCEDASEDDAVAYVDLDVAGPDLAAILSAGGQPPGAWLFGAEPFVSSDGRFGAWSPPEQAAEVAAWLAGGGAQLPADLDDEQAGFLGPYLERLLAFYATAAAAGAAVVMTAS